MGTTGRRRCGARCDRGGDHLAKVSARFAAELPGSAAALPERVLLFGITNLPPLHVEALRALSERVEVHLFSLTPSADLRTNAHPLFASSGKLLRDMAELVGASTSERYETPDPSRRLGALQADLLTGALVPRELGADDSVQIHACHGPMRQVEVLREVLVRLFDEHPHLEARDVVVMTPNIEAYAPLVQAVFADQGGHLRLPFRVADRGLRFHNLVGDALLATLGLVGERASASQVLELLALEPVRARFHLDADDLPDVRRWVAESGVRWGIDDAHREAHGQPGGDPHTWRAGLDRLLLGAAMEGEGADLYGGVLPYDEVEGQATRAVGSLVDFAETLFRHLRSLEAPRPMAAWRDDLEALLADLYAHRDPETWMHMQVREMLADLADGAEAAGLTADLDRGVVVALLEERLGDGSAPTGFLSGAITFCELRPMRTIPFKVVCLLGMDDGAFPRSRTRPGFDLLAVEPRPGDRTLRDDDRALFLEALLAAREHLVVTYTGRDIRDNKARAPAVPVGELVDALEETCGDPKLVRQHPLQAFSPDNFDVGAPFSHDRRALEAARALREPTAERLPFVYDPLPPLEPGPIDLDELCKFYASPPRALLLRRLDLWVKDREDPVSDHLPLELDGLGFWGIGNRLLELRLARGPDFDPTEAFAAAGIAPPGLTGQHKRDQAWSGVQTLAARFERERGGPRRHPLDLDLAVGGHRVVGRVGDLYPEGRFEVTWSNIHGKHRLPLWIRHLALQVAGHPVPSALLGKKEDVRLRPVPPERARQELGKLLDRYVSGLSQRFAFVPNTTYAWISASSVDGAWSAAEDAWKKETERDPAIGWVFGGLEPAPGSWLGAKMVEEARYFWTPAREFGA